MVQYINGLPLNLNDVRNHRLTLRNEDSFTAVEVAREEIFKIIRIQEYKRLSSDHIRQLAILSIHTLTCTVQGLHQETKNAIRQEREALKALPKAGLNKGKKMIKSIRRRNRAWIVSLIDMWLAIR
ncbi:hypothetical protein FoTM2_014656 [Fusarium oxysporum f. sp. vasinfectum]|uniref:Uncharacterized protein n=1 Tax=Fusarium oxysporum f. sp. vasinfectum 25433 TaxID=1089449 RepID=X0KIE3_FUSOX|nr:hypothetical protein FOTG_18265 [Fusarium oxysporum f. sp. vasinfectum 25433]KAK2926287.1 hypothetical protein FoTM2_014656 [Fusarium oxysporum f. sp. vasinfectum]